MTFQHCRQKHSKEIQKTTYLVEARRIVSRRGLKYPCLYNKAEKPYKERDIIRDASESVSSALEFVDDGMFKYYWFY